MSEFRIGGGLGGVADILDDSGCVLCLEYGRAGNDDVCTGGCKKTYISDTDASVDLDIEFKPAFVGFITEVEVYEKSCG